MRLLRNIIVIKIFFIVLAIISNNLIDQRMFEVKDLRGEVEYVKEKYLNALVHLNQLKSYKRIDSMAKDLGLEWFDQDKLKVLAHKKDEQTQR